MLLSRILEIIAKRSQPHKSFLSTTSDTGDESTESYQTETETSDESDCDYQPGERNDNPSCKF